jgi:hypothetical protein
MRTLTIKGRKLITGLGRWRRHEADDGGGLVEHLGGGAYRNLMRLYPASGRAIVMFGNLTSYPVERLTAAVLRADPPHPRPAARPDDALPQSLTACRRAISPSCAGWRRRWSRCSWSGSAAPC